MVECRLSAGHDGAPRRRFPRRPIFWSAIMKPGIVTIRCCIWLCAVWAVVGLNATDARAQPDAFRGPDVNRPGPWDQDVFVYRVDTNGAAEKLATFDRAGVPTAARLADGRLMAAYQCFPADDPAGFDKVAVRFSADEGLTWTEPRVIRLNGLPEGMRFPFDPTLVPLPDKRIRLYFTSLKGRRFDESRPAIYSAISDDGLAYEFEPGARFEVEGRPVIDCAVVLHEGIFHLFSPDNGAGGPPGAPGEDRRPLRDRPREGVGYHAVSRDGLNFVRQPDVEIEGRRRWLGNVVSDGDRMIFVGTGDPGVWMARSTNGADWTLLNGIRGIPAADPGAVKFPNGDWLILGTGPPRPGTPSARQRQPAP
jgi:hypothetical protein